MGPQGRFVAPLRGTGEEKPGLQLLGQDFSGTSGTPSKPPPLVAATSTDSSSSSYSPFLNEEERGGVLAKNGGGNPGGGSPEGGGGLGALPPPGPLPQHWADLATDLRRMQKGLKAIREGNANKKSARAVAPSEMTLQEGAVGGSDAAGPQGPLESPLY